ncbi:MAG: YbaK/EbsC family protein [Candidatus Omnitrophica bacterium]|nr:YbaK/EbsC family protein [Candidatus Omnitrophota bacterium]
MPSRKLKEFLDTNGIKYLTIQHSPAYTAQEIAAQAHIHGKELAKTVIINKDEKLAMAVLPANYHIDVEVLKKATGAKSLTIATEQEFKDAFPECEIGAMPPFGNLYGMETFVEDSLTENKEIVFNAGTHTELIRISFDDFVKLVKPKIMSFIKI